MGTQLVAVVVCDSRVVIDYKFYWGLMLFFEEVRFVCVILNAFVYICLVVLY